MFLPIIFCQSHLSVRQVKTKNEKRQSDAHKIVISSLIMQVLNIRVHLKYLSIHAMILRRTMTSSEDEVKDTYKVWLLFKFRQGKV